MRITYLFNCCQFHFPYFAQALPSFDIFFIYQEKLCLFFNNSFPWGNTFSFITRDYGSFLLSICTTFIQFTHIFWRFNKNFLDIFFSKWYIVFINWKNLRVLTERVECKPRGVGGLWTPTVWAVFEIFMTAVVFNRWQIYAMLLLTVSQDDVCLRTDYYKVINL